MLRGGVGLVGWLTSRFGVVRPWGWGVTPHPTESPWPPFPGYCLETTEGSWDRSDWGQRTLGGNGFVVVFRMDEKSKIAAIFLNKGDTFENKMNIWCIYSYIFIHIYICIHYLRYIYRYCVYIYICIHICIYIYIHCKTKCIDTRKRSLCHPRTQFNGMPTCLNIYIYVYIYVYNYI